MGVAGHAGTCALSSLPDCGRWGPPQAYLRGLVPGSAFQPGVVSHSATQHVKLGPRRALSGAGGARQCVHARMQTQRCPGLYLH